MTTVGDLVNQVRSWLTGGLSDEISLLDEDYTPGDANISLRYPKANLGPGALVSLGLNTFYVLEVSNGGRTLRVFSGIDGSPDTAVTAGEVVRIRPIHTTWTIFNEWNRQILALSAPNQGLYAYGSFTSLPDYIDGTYPLPDTTAWNGVQPIRLLLAHYQPYGGDFWVRIGHAEYQTAERVIRIVGAQPEGATLEFVLAVPFNPASALTTDPHSLGLSEYNWDIPGLGVAATLSRGLEGRRAQPFSQGDSRRPSEVQVGAQIGISRDWEQQRQQRIFDEVSRQQRLYPYFQSVTGVGSP